jgi:hypothetical protein
MKLRSAFVSALGVTALVQFASPAGAVSLINENFNAVPQGLNQTGTVGAFTVTGGNVDVKGTGFVDLYPGNGNYIDLNGNTGGTLTSTNTSIALNAGSTLSFDFGSNTVPGTPTSANVFFGGVNIGTVNASPSSVFSTFNYTFSSDAIGALSFVSNNSGPGGVIIDNIMLDTAAIVPEPSAIPGMLLFAGGMVMLRRKYVAKKAK